MSKIQDLQDALHQAFLKAPPRKPVRVVVGYADTWKEVMSDPSALQVFDIEKGKARSIRGVPIVAAGGSDKDFDFRIEY